MNYKIKLVVEYQANQLDYIFEDIVNAFQCLIWHYIKKVPMEYAEDLQQEILYTLNNVLIKFEMLTLNNINKSLFNSDNITLLKANNYQNINEILGSNYLKGFVEKYGAELFDSAFYDEISLNKFLNEYELFCNENQFTVYLNTSFKNCELAFSKKNNEYKSKNLLSLNLKDTDGNEIIDTIVDNSTIEKEEIINKSLLSDKDKVFLDILLTSRLGATEKEIAKNTGISQQAVNNMKKRLIKRYKNSLEKEKAKEINLNNSTF